MKLQGENIAVSIDEVTGALSIKNKVAGALFRQVDGPDVVKVCDIRADENNIFYSVELSGGKGLCAQVSLEGEDVLLTLEGNFAFEGEIAYPGAFDVLPGDVALIPQHQGMAFPVDDPNVLTAPIRPGFSGWYHSMQFFAMTRGENYLISHVENSLDYVEREERGADGLLRTQLSWIPQLRAWGPSRTIRYMTGSGGIVGAMKRYRCRMKEKGYLVTLREKARTVPNIEKIIGAANLWIWDADPRAIAQELKARGIDKALWSNRESPEDVAYLRDEAGYLVGRYDMYRDVPTPEIRARWTDEERDTPEEDKGYMLHPDAWPDDIVIAENGERQTCWKIRYDDGTELPMECMCGMSYTKYASRDVMRDLRCRGYEARFVDTVTAAEFVECFHPQHPATREMEGKWRLRAVELMSDLGLVTGVEDMMDIAVPYAVYSEGLMSPGPYRQTDAGYYFQKHFYGEDVDDTIPTFELNPSYRVPLWELVFHDCIINYWYWGDNSITHPEYTSVRDVFNALYGTLPLYGVVVSKDWEDLKEAVFASYPRATKVARMTGYDEMTDFTYLTPDKKVQRTAFANGVRVTANFSSKAYICADGISIAPKDFRVESA